MLLWEKILRGASDEPTRNRALDAIHQSTVAQSKMVEEITDLSRCVSGNLEIERSIVALDRVIEAAVQGATAGATDKGVALTPSPRAPWARSAAMRRGCGKPSTSCSRTR